VLGSRGGNGLTTRCLETDCSLEGIIKPPLETSECTNHDDSCEKSSPESLESDFGVDLADVFSERSLSLDGVELGDHGISRVRDDSAEDTSAVSRHECDGELLTLGVFASRLSEDLGVEELNDLLECNELDNSVRDLSHP